jgi:hypothetical protein
LSLRRSPQLTPASLAARRANALKSTGPRSAAGKARSCLNALRHGRRARDLRAMLARTGDSEALFLLDWFHHHIPLFWRPRKERTWRYTIRLAARVSCFMNGRSLRPRARETQKKADGKRAVRTYQYGDAAVCSERPQGLQIAYKRGPGVRFLNPTPTRRKHFLLGWLPEFRYVPGPPRKVKRVRRVGPEGEMKNSVQTKLECGEESMSCYDSNNRQVETAVATPGADPQGGLEGPDPNGQNLDGRAPPLPSCEVTFAEEEPWMFWDPDDHDWEACQASHTLIEEQWSKWRRAHGFTCGFPLSRE